MHDMWLSLAVKAVSTSGTKTLHFGNLGICENLWRIAKGGWAVLSDHCRPLWKYAFNTLNWVRIAATTIEN
jgi:hypothetical protein